MRAIKIIGLLTLFLGTFGFIGCSNDDEDGRKVTDYKEIVLTVASKEIPGVLDGHNYVSEVYAVKKNDADKWGAYGAIAGFEYEKDYEYKIKISETSYLDYSMNNPAWTERKLLEVISKDKKDSENLPLHFIPESYYQNIPLPQYSYKVEAENKSLIKDDLEANSILPKDYHYMLCRGHEGLKWIGIQHESHVLGPYIVKTENKKPEEMPESYKILPPDGTVASGAEWTFLDESGNTTNHPSFDVFIVRPTKTKAVDRTPYVVYFYKDLTRYYQGKFPAAGVNTVVISYKVLLFNVIYE